MPRKVILGLLAAFSTLFAAGTCAAHAPAELKIGTLYATSGNFAAASRQGYYGLKLWIDEMNAHGGVYVKPYHKKIPIKLFAYDDQSNTATAATLYNQLITQDKVDILVADSGGSVVTSVAVPIARDHKMLLIDQTGTGTPFFTKDNPYIVLTGAAMASIWPKDIDEFLTTDGVKLGIKRVALLYGTNDFTAPQANAVRSAIKASGAPVKIVYDHGVPTNTTSYTVIINNIRATNPDAVLEFGFPNNDISYLRNLQDSGLKFKWQFVNFLGIDPDVIEKAVGVKGLEYVYSYVTPSMFEHKVEYGMSLPQYRAAWDKKYGGSKVAFSETSIVGYTTGLLLEKALATTESMQQLALRKAIFTFSGKLKTLNGTFKLNDEGAQVGEIFPLGQVLPNGKGGLKFVVVYPHDLATGNAVYPAK